MLSPCSFAVPAERTFLTHIDFTNMLITYFFLSACLFLNACNTQPSTYSLSQEPAQYPPHATAAYQTLHAMAVSLSTSAKTSHNISRSGNLAAIRSNADQVFASIWGLNSGLLNSDAEPPELISAAEMHGWKTRWQNTYSDFDSAFSARYGSAPPAITDPQLLGIAGQGRALRRALVKHHDPDSTEPLIASLNNVIGWMRLDDGVTKAERQPRIDLTYRWDADKAFWHGSADTGWLFEAQAQSAQHS